MKERIFSIIVQNRFGVLAKVSSLFSRRGCNIRSLTVFETQEPGLSRMTIVFAEEDEKALQIYHQLGKLEDVKRVALLAEMEI
ncbi:MAG: acetolactate synthase small subunit [Oscillospiraceae bacterium]|jgi:acetolactate synthase-1/3 small subunit|nr:acetolactate synthase small subunit [Oscillospiraceae bacterium]